MDPAELAMLVENPLPFLTRADPEIRRLAVSACANRISDAGVVDALLERLAEDPAGRVRAEAAEVLGFAGSDAVDALLRAADDEDPVVREAVATGLGEIEDDIAVPWLIDAARDDADRLVREAAVAALGAIGDERAVPLLLDLVSVAPPHIRRRSVVALTVFDGAEVEAAIRAAASDRNPMVREAAEMVVGLPHTWEPVEITEPPQ